MSDRTQRRVVCAAIRNPNGEIIPSARHFDTLMHELISHHEGDWKAAEQGFIDQWGKFMTRKEALKIAHDADQFIGVKCQPFTELFSEDLY